jgi:hypothetical protein
MNGMTSREILITTALLDALDKLDGTPAPETILHAAILEKTLPPPTLAEFKIALRHCDVRGWLIGLPSRITDQTKWTLSDKGRAAFAELA